MTQLLIIGGSDAGISAALKAKELAPETQVTIILADAYPNFSICGLPFFLSGEVADWKNLAHRSREEITQLGITLLINQTATSINPSERTVTTVNSEGKIHQLNYDKLVIATGATSSQPKIAGLDHPGVYFLRWMGDSFAVHQHLTQLNPQSALIIGGGYIGMEMADALTLRGLKVTAVEHSPTVLKTVAPSLGQIVATELQHRGVNVVTGVAIETILEQNKQLNITGSAGFQSTADLVLVAVGATPNVELAQTAGVELGIGSAIKVNRYMETNISHIYAAGDCVETWHRLLDKPVYLPLGTTAHKQGRIAGENALGGSRQFAGSLGTQVVKIFDLAIARTGLRENEAAAAGFKPTTVETKTWHHKAYYPGAHQLIILVTGDLNTGRLLGAQILGHYQAEVAKRIDIFATAIYHGMKVWDVENLDLSYTPPLSSPFDPVQMSTQAWCQKQKLTLVENR
ncbi:MAG: FAD-dependent oxidoreductase [Cyanobacteria bacterium P01_E01_bin.35]